MTRKFEPMKRIIITLICFLTIAGIQAQTKTTYYKNSSFKKIAPRNKARYKIVKFMKNDTVITQAYKIRGNRFLSSTKVLNGKPVGIWYKYNHAGYLVYREDFNQLVYSDVPVRNLHGFVDENSKDEYLKQAIPPGGDDGFKMYILYHLHYPAIETRSLHHTGTVWIRFYIDTDGSAVPYSIIKGVDPYIDLAAWEFIKKFQKWIPAEESGKPVREMETLELNFHPGMGVAPCPTCPPDGSYPVHYDHTPHGAYTGPH